MPLYRHRFTIALVLLTNSGIPWLRGQLPSARWTAKCPELLCPAGTLPPPGRCRAPPRKALPFLHCSYELTRQPTPFRLLQPWPRLADLCRLLPVLAESGAFPTLSPRDLAWMSGPLPRWDTECSCSLLPPYRRPSPTGNGSASHKLPPDDFLVGAVFEAAAIP